MVAEAVGSTYGKVASRCGTPCQFIMCVADSRLKQVLGFADIYGIDVGTIYIIKGVVAVVLMAFPFVPSQYAVFAT